LGKGQGAEAAGAVLEIQIPPVGEATKKIGPKNKKGIPPHFRNPLFTCRKKLADASWCQLVSWTFSP